MFSRAALLIAVTAVALAAPAGASAKPVKDCAGKTVKVGRYGVPARAVKLFSAFKRPAHPLSAKRRALLCESERHSPKPFGLIPSQARRLAAPVKGKSAWFLIPGRGGIIVDAGGTGVGDYYPGIASRGYVAGETNGARPDWLGAVVDGFTSVKAEGTARDGSAARFTTPIRHNIFYLPTPGANPESVPLTFVP